MRDILIEPSSLTSCVGCVSNNSLINTGEEFLEHYVPFSKPVRIICNYQQSAKRFSFWNLIFRNGNVRFLAKFKRRGLSSYAAIWMPCQPRFYGWWSSCLSVAYASASCVHLLRVASFVMTSTNGISGRINLNPRKSTSFLWSTKTWWLRSRRNNRRYASVLGQIGHICFRALATRENPFNKAILHEPSTNRLSSMIFVTAMALSGDFSHISFGIRSG